MASNMNYLETMLQRVVTAKSAAAKSAKPLSEPGSIGGETTHPVKSIDDDGLESASEGAHAKENEREVKKVKKVDPPDLKSEHDADTDQGSLGIGATQSSTGGDPATEDDYGGEIKDPGSSHPARVDNKGEKYAQVRALPLIEQAGVVVDQVERFLAKVAAAKSAAAQTSEPTPATAPTPQSSEDLSKAAEAGYQAADALARQHAIGVEVLTKFAHDAEHMADLTVAYLLQKRAEAEAEMMSEPGMREGGPGAMMGGGGMPPGAMMGGHEPDGDEGGQIDPEAIQELLAVLAEKGLSLEDLEALAAQEDGDGGMSNLGGAPAGGDPGMAMGGMGGGGPKMAAVRVSDAERETIKFAAAAAREYLNQGLYRPGRPTTNKAATLRDEMRQYLGELFGR